MLRQDQPPGLSCFRHLPEQVQKGCTILSTGVYISAHHNASPTAAKSLVRSFLGAEAPSARLLFGDAVVHEAADQDQRVRATVVLDHIDIGVQVIYLRERTCTSSAIWSDTDLTTATTC